jgi:polyvinyl alcohol dehydrogenase (cytochrome)
VLSGRPDRRFLAALLLVLAMGPLPFVSARAADRACDWPMYGREPGRTFAGAEGCTPLNPRNVVALTPKWVKKTPAVVSASPAVVDGVVYVGSWDGRMYALDAGDGREIWVSETAPAPGANWGPIVSSAAVSDVDGRRLVVFGAGPRVYALDARNGREVWVTHIGDRIKGETTQVESSPVVWQGRVYVGMDTHNDAPSRPGGVVGGLLMLDAATGDVLDKFLPELDGPYAGCGGIWGSPALDTANGRVYVGTANCYPYPDPYPGTPHTTAITALDALTFEVLWSFQPHAGEEDRDLDFGATPNLFTVGGRTLLGAGSKDGSYYVLDAGTGTKLSEAKVSQPVDGIGGFIGSPAVWRGRVFGGTAIASRVEPAYHAVDVRIPGKPVIRWEAYSAPTYGASAVAGGVVFTGALDSLLRAYDAETGRLAWLAPVSGPISSGPAVVGDSVYVGAGTSSTDLCAKGRPGSPQALIDRACRAAFKSAVGSLGGIHAFQLRTPGGTR